MFLKTDSCILIENRQSNIEFLHFLMFHSLPFIFLHCEEGRVLVHSRDPVARCWWKILEFVLTDSFLLILIFFSIGCQGYQKKEDRFWFGLFVWIWHRIWIISAKFHRFESAGWLGDQSRSIKWPEGGYGEKPGPSMGSHGGICWLDGSYIG